MSSPIKDTRRAKSKEANKDGNDSKVAEIVGNIANVATTRGTKKKSLVDNETKIVTSRSSKYG